MFEGAALAKFESRLKFEKEKLKKKDGKGGGESKGGRLKSVEFFKSMEVSVEQQHLEHREGGYRKEVGKAEGRKEDQGNQVPSI